jgi:hypothetical protein
MMTENHPYRQIHLDFHTAPQIPNVAADFDPQAFVATLQRAHVNSVTVFAKCHHGYSYYSTRVGTPHPHLRRDLLGEMLDALRAANIRAPVYTTVVWDEHAWATHPEWRQVTPQGAYAITSGSRFRAGWKSLCMNTSYADYVIAQNDEILERYNPVGLFIDIVRYVNGPCVCDTCLGLMRDAGVNPEDPQHLARFALDSERRFMARCTAAIRARKPAAQRFYNSRLLLRADPELGNRPELDNFTHIEIESLPGGDWGYDHFPMYVRYFQTIDRPLIGMMGRFHTTWGDFGGLRDRAALEFECFRALAHGAGCSIGDQLHPGGRLEPAVYERIGEVYAEVQRREPWCLDSHALPEIAVISASGGAHGSGFRANPSDTGALHMFEQLKCQFQFIDAGGDLAPYAVVVLPDDVLVDETLAARLRAFVQGGGKLLISGCSGLNAERGDYTLADLMGVHYDGPAPFAPDYLLAGPEIADGIAPMPHVCEAAGVRLRAIPGVMTLATSGAPYFNRTWEHFCSHQYTPFSHDSGAPLVVEHGGVITIARPLFAEYAQSSRTVHRRLIANCLARLLPRPRIGMHNLPSAAVVTVRQRGADLIVHLLHYIPQRRGNGLDVVEDVLPLHNIEVRVRTERAPGAVRAVPEDQPLEYRWEDGYVTLHVPVVRGYQILQLQASTRA